MVDGVVPGLVVLALGLTWVLAWLMLALTPAEGQFRVEAIYVPTQRNGRSVR